MQKQLHVWILDQLAFGIDSGLIICSCSKCGMNAIRSEKDKRVLYFHSSIPPREAYNPPPCAAFSMRKALE